MRIDALSLDFFRNYLHFEAEFHPEVNVICGDNAQGKTNLLEAVAYLTGVSHRARYDRELIQFGVDHAFLKGGISAHQREYLLEAELHRGARRKLKSNGVPLKNIGELSGLFQSVLFCPEDLYLIREGAAERRRFLDECVCQLRPRYAQALAEYKRLHEHKTRILRDSEEKPSLLETLDEFSLGMARAGAVLIHYRAHFIRKLAEKAQIIQREFSGGGEELALSYQTMRTVTDPLGPTVTLYEALREHQNSHRRAELEAKSCLSGPHKDDLLAAINGQPARQFASQGQTRTAALSLKLAEREIFQEDTGQWPILLLDDVLSELDQRRQDFVLGRITGGQVFITGCQPPEAGTFPGNSLHIVQGTLVDAGAADDLA